ncbi:unnamed protein product [Urochloa humidicola]
MAGVHARGGVHPLEGAGLTVAFHCPPCSRMRRSGRRCYDGPCVDDTVQASISGKAAPAHRLLTPRRGSCSARTTRSRRGSSTSPATTPHG